MLAALYSIVIASPSMSLQHGLAGLTSLGSIAVHLLARCDVCSQHYALMGRVCQSPSNSKIATPGQYYGLAGLGSNSYSIFYLTCICRMS